MRARGELNELGINPGQLRHRITLLESSNVIDAAGVSTVYAPGNPPVQAWARIETERAEDAIRGGEDVTQAYLKVTIRHNVAFAANKRIQAPSGNQYIIRGVENPLEMNAYMVLVCLGVGANN